VLEPSENEIELGRSTWKVMKVYGIEELDVTRKERLSHMMLNHVW
jgi:hypothetical protein